MARAARGEDLGRLHGARASAAEVTRLRRRIVGSPATARAELPGIDTKRVDLMPAAAVLLDVVLARAGAPELVACTWALREGVLLDLAGISGQRGAGAPDARRRSIEDLAERFVGANAHGKQVARLATTLFDATATALALPASARELLEYAALLHDIGHVVEHHRHHRQSCYLIRNAELLGFDPIEVECIAQVARGHRKQSPRMADPELRALPASARRTVRALAALLRLGDALDRTHFGVVRDLRTIHHDGRLVIEVDAGRTNAELELWAAERRADLLARLLDLPVVVRARPARRTATLQPSVRSGAHARRA
jgi:exopolyphosphatase/guanosine-5'-triphosphate,3'-diphosphate pyrophosphatase